MLESKDLNHPLTATETHVIDYLNDHIANIASLSITDIAEKTYVSVATVSRAIRKCGFTSFTAARFHLAQEHTTAAGQLQMNRVLAESYRECVRTIESINVNDILTVAHHILQAPRVILLTRSASSSVAQDFCVQLVSLKCNAAVISDGEMMQRLDQFLRPDDMVIALTLYNSTPTLYTAAKLAKDAGCYVVTCCCKTGTNLQQISDVTVLGYSAHDMAEKKRHFSSRIPLMIITRIIVKYIALIREPENTALDIGDDVF